MGSCLSAAREQPSKSPGMKPVSGSRKIRHSAAASKQSSRGRGSQATWLDRLPTNVCSRIAHFVSNGKPCLDALRLAEVSIFQRVGVLEALSYKFSNECLENDLEARWSAVFSDNVREIDITSGFYEACLPLLELLKAPALRKVTILGEEGVMRALAGSTSVKELTLHVTGETAFETLSEMLCQLDLSHVSLICMSFYDHDDCAFFPLVNPEYVNKFAEACKKLSYLFVDCDHEFQEHPTWTLLKAMPSVQETTIDIAPPKNLLPRLRSFKSVEIESSVSDWRFLVDELGPVVTRLQTYCITDQPSLAKEESDFTKLANCPNICDLEICVKNGVEESLLQVLPKLRSLRRLVVRWVFQLTSDNVMEYNNPLYHAPAPGIITSMVKACPDLEKVCLRCVRCSTQEQDEVLRVLGDRLLEVEVSFNGQEEHTFDRIEAFLRSTIMYNHSLHKIGLVEEDRVNRLCEDESKADIDGIEKQRSRLLQLLSVLRRRSSNLDDSDLYDHIASMEAPENLAAEVTIHHEDGSKTVHDA